jgi:O-antigen/teichoic acid export membrane protein
MKPIGPRLSDRSRRAVITTLDQGMFSVSNFAVGIAIARIAGPVGLGSYSLAYALWLAFQALHRALITDPMAIENEVSQPRAHEHLASGLASELLLGVGATCLFGLLGASLLVSGEHKFGMSLIALAPWLPALLAQDYWRWIGFMQAKPGKSLANDLVFDGFQASVFVGLIVSGMRSPVAAISAWGAGATAGAIFGLRQFSVRPTFIGGGAKLRTHWPMSRWLSANGLTSWGSSQSYAVLTAATLGPVGVGVLRAAQTLVGGVALVLLQSAGSLGLPEACRGLKEHGIEGLNKVTRFITTAAVAAVGGLALVVAFDGAQLLRICYGPQFGRYGTVATILAASLVVSASSIGAILALKATRRTRTLFWIIFTETVVTTAAIAVLSLMFGITGAALGIGLGSVVATASLLVARRRTLRSGGAWRPADASPQGDLVQRLAALKADVVRARRDAEIRTGALVGHDAMQPSAATSYPMPLRYGPLRQEWES